MTITSPAFDIQSFECHGNAESRKDRVLLFSDQRRLLISKKRVTVLQGTVLSKKLVYEENVIAATYTTFRPSRQKSEYSSSIDEVEALAVCLAKSAYIYYPGGQYYVVSFPFTLKRAYPFEAGLILEREQDSLSRLPTSSQYHSSRFFTLVDPIGDFRVVTTSSTSVVNSHENLVYFPRSGINKSKSLCATFNQRNGTLSVYHIKASSRNAVVGGSGVRKRKSHALSTPNPSKKLEDDILHDFNNPFTGSISQNMEKKRTSTLLSGVSSIGRMGSESGFAEAGKATGTVELSGLRKDMILTKVDSFTVNAKRDHLSTAGLHYQGEEAIVVSNKASKETQIFIFKSQNAYISQHESSTTIQCLHAIPLEHTRFPGWLLILKDDKSLQMFHPFLDITAPAIDLSGNYPAISGLSSSYDNSVSLIAQSGESHIIRLILEPKNEFVGICLDIWRYLSGSKINEHVWVFWRSALVLDKDLDEWRAYVIVILSLVFPFDGSESDVTINGITELLPLAKKHHEYFDFDYSLQELLPYIVVALHLIYEETKLDTLAKKNLDRLGLLLTQLTTWMGWSDQWTTFYMVDNSIIDRATKLLSTILLYSPPNLFESLVSIFENKRSRYPKFSQLVEEGDSVNMMMTPRTHIVLEIFEILVSHEPAKAIVKALATYGITSNDLETFPLGISMPIKECLLQCQSDPDLSWDIDILKLIGRSDLIMTAEDQSDPLYHNSNGPLSSKNLMSNELKSSSAIISDLLEPSKKKEDPSSSNAERTQITDLIFDHDRRFYEILNLLNQTKVQSTTLAVDEGMTEYDSTLLKREVASLVALRTLTLPLGRAALFYEENQPMFTEKFPIPDLNLSTIIAPSMSTIVLSKESISPKIFDWGSFHNGASSGLSISRNCEGITGSWAFYNKPAENFAQHAGFLLGLGLNGHLKKLEEWHIYNYLGPKHPLTSIGLLIGMAASLKGTMDNKLTKVLSVHAVALLPQGANDLNVPNTVQSAGLIGIGLLYLETQHRRMSDILLSQVSGTVSHIEHDEEFEGYMLAAGLALGFVNLGKGDDLRGVNDTHVVDKLLSISTSMRDSQSELESDKSGSAAIMALAFMYMRTENRIIADKLEVPSSEHLLDYVRPDLLLLRTVAKNLIMWNQIRATTQWVDSQIPEVLRAKHKYSSLETLDSDQVGYYNILAGACLSITLKYASSQNLSARTTLLGFLDSFMTITESSAANYDEQVALNCASQIQNVLAIAVAVVMAGSGDLEVFRRLRVLHGRINKTHQYGNHMAVNMALGFLFLGGGQYAFSDTNFAIACLFTSLYPVFPAESNEFEVHLQALRHFWALSVEPKCLIIRDVADGSPVKIPVTIVMKDGSKRESTAPQLLPRLEAIASIEVKAPEYFNVKIDFSVPSEYMTQFRKSLTIFVYKKCNYELLKTTVNTLLKNESKALQIANKEVTVNRDLAGLLDISLLSSLTSFEKQIYLYESSDNVQHNDTNAFESGLSMFNMIANKIDLHLMATQPKDVQDLLSLKLLFAYTDHVLEDDMHFVSLQFVEQLKQQLWEVSAASAQNVNAQSV
ncbi:hypothetical protein FT663_04598 [Candidozyma haemuli var. vulneris]|nr:hypothetical protein FT663_04598 [[Candida] haemuloni var. vulneris]KAF3993852.1 hypothetical protein FT662_00300 [[Candida] haemuloni var. vulneris]